MSKSRLWLGAGMLTLSACATVSKRDDGPALPAAAVGQDEQQGSRDYSPGGLFAERHGAYWTRSKRYEPKVFARYMLLPNTKVTSEPGSFDMQELRVRGDAPIVLDPDSYLTLGGEFRHRRYDFTNNVLGADDEDVYVVGARLGAGVFVNDDVLIEGMFRPGLYSDLDGTLTSKDWQWFGHGLATFRMRDDLFLKAGVAVSQDFADVDVIPLAGITWVIDEQFRIDVLLPHRIEGSWSPNAGITTVHAGAYLEGDQYRVRSSSGSGKRRVDWQTQEIRLAAGVDHRLSDYLSVFGEIGSTIAGDTKLRNGTSQSFTGSIEPTFFFNVGIGFDF
ncbi:MAG: hypothetical protein R3F56_03420 [Planctomycetota bacterium]